MGKLAFYGALAGAGKGMQELSANAREERLSEVEHMRQRRIAEWQSAQQDKRQESQQEFTLELTGVQNEFTAGESERGREFTAEQSGLNREFSADESQKGRDFSASESEKGREFSSEEASKGRDFSAREAWVGREFTAEQSRLDRESRERVAKFNAMSKSGNTPDWIKQRFERTTQVEKNRYGETVNETMAMFDKRDGVTYVLKDSVWQLPNSEIKKPPEKTNPKAVRRLAETYRENPSEMYNFLEIHGWLPIWIFSGQQATIGKD